MFLTIERTQQDEDVLRELLRRKAALAPQPVSYEGLVIIKPWGYEMQAFDNGHCSVWLACLRPKQAVSMHCHQHKKAMFLPITQGVVLRVLSSSLNLDQGVVVDRGVFHSQENNGPDDVYFLEYEWPSDKTDLIRYKDRYGRESKGYEGTSQMLPWAEAVRKVIIPDRIKAMMGRAA